MLSEVNEDEVLKYWEGLGYYSRVCNFYIVVKEVNNNYDGEVLYDFELFKKLKGVGLYI